MDMEKRGTEPEEKNFKKALLNRYLEDQVLYNKCCQTNRLSSDYEDDIDDRNGSEDDSYEDEVFSRLSNDVIVKINEGESSKPILNRRERIFNRKMSPQGDELDANGNIQITSLGAQAKFSRSLDERQFKSLYLDLPNNSESIKQETNVSKTENFLKSKNPVRKYSDCSSNFTRNFTPTYSARLTAEDASMCSSREHATRMLARGFKKKISLPGPGFAPSRLFGGRKPSLSLSAFDCSMQSANGHNEKETNRMSLSSFKSSCSSFVEVEFGDSDYDRSCTSSPCSPLTGASRFPPINNDN